MRSLGFDRYALISGAAAAILAGCGGSQPPIGAPGNASQTSASTSDLRPAHRLPASYQLLYRFHPPLNGEHPSGGLLDVDGVLYGTTMQGGLSGEGTIYTFSPRGVHKVIYNFAGGSDGANPSGALLNVNGTLYGTTIYGGGSGCAYNLGCGTVYSVSTSGTEKVLYAFKGGTDGAEPYAGLIDVNGVLYGTTAQGGLSGCSEYQSVGCGAVFNITTSGQETVLYRFADGSDGAFPHAELTDVNGVLYGTTVRGGERRCFGYYGCGTVFSVTTSGKETVLHSFKNGSDGLAPISGLTNVNGTLYGTTSEAGGGGCGGGCGTIFQISASGSGYGILHSFQGKPDGGDPLSGVIAVQGTLYGTTSRGGCCDGKCHIGYGCGTVYSISPSGAETVLYKFTGRRNGAWPVGPLTNVNGRLYGATTYGGDHATYIYGYGTLFALTP